MTQPWRWLNSIHSIPFILKHISCLGLLHSIKLELTFLLSVWLSSSSDFSASSSDKSLSSASLLSPPPSSLASDACFSFFFSDLSFSCFSSASSVFDVGLVTILSLLSLLLVTLFNLGVSFTSGFLFDICFFVLFFPFFCCFCHTGLFSFTYKSAKTTKLIWNMNLFLQIKWVCLTLKV